MRLVALHAAVVCASASSLALASPQANVGVTVGGAMVEARGPAGPHGAFHLGARADVLFLRQRDREMAVGPYVDFVSEGFGTAEVGAGGEWLVPVWSTVPFVFSAGGVARKARGYAWEPGVAAGVFLGSRSYNFHSAYQLAGGLFLQGRYGFGDARQADLIAGLQVDLTLLAYPFVFLYQAVRR